MDFKNIESFLTLAELLNFTKSAEAVCLSQSAFSRQITCLENEFGCSLFYRDKRNVKLTEFGLAFMPYANRIYKEVKLWEEHIRQLESKVDGELKVGYLCDLPERIIPTAVKAFKKGHPNVNLMFSDYGQSAILMGLLQGDIDCAFTLTSQNEKLSNFETLLLESYPLCAVLPRNHKFAGRKTISLKELAEERFVMISDEIYGSGTRHVEYLCKAAGFTPKISERASFVPSLLTLVAFGSGIALVSSIAKELAPWDIVFIPLEDEFATTDLMLLWQPADVKSSLLAFIDSTKNVYSNK